MDEVALIVPCTFANKSELMANQRVERVTPYPLLSITVALWKCMITVSPMILLFEEAKAASPGSSISTVLIQHELA